MMTERPDEIETALDTSQPYSPFVQSVKSLDPDCWMGLLDAYAPLLREEICASLLKRKLPLELADDIEQEMWLTAIRRMDEFVWEDEEKFRHWLRVIALNHIRTYRRKQGSYLSYDDFASDSDTDSELTEFLDTYRLWDDDSVEDRVISRERLAMLDRAMRALKPVEREIFMRWITGETPRELALEYDQKPRAVSMMLWRAKEKIQAQLDLTKSKDDWNG